MTDGNVRHLFVYGTLKKGERNHEKYFTGHDFVGPAVTAEAAYAMRDVDGDPGEGEERFYPAVYSHPSGAKIAGEVYAIDEDTLVLLDALEEVGTLYERRSITLEGGRTADTYIHLGTPAQSVEDSPRIAFDEKTRTLSWHTRKSGA